MQVYMTTATVNHVIEVVESSSSRGRAQAQAQAQGFAVRQPASCATFPPSEMLSGLPTVSDDQIRSYGLLVPVSVTETAASVSMP